MEYNFAVLGSGNDYFEYSYMELNADSSPNTCYLSNPFDTPGLMNRILMLTCRAHFSSKMNRFFTLPFKGIWNPFLFKDPFSNQNPICFLFFPGGPYNNHYNNQILYGFIEYLKKTYPNSKYAVFYQDLVAHSRPIGVDQYKEMMDLVLSFDKEDCAKYGLIYHPLVYSDIAGQIVPYETMSDVYFCGAAKNRLDEILAAYDHLVSLGLKCDFHIITLKPEEAAVCHMHAGINVCSHMAYEENLRHVASCHYLLEIMQKHATGYTLRTCEAIAFNKKLISNNRFLKEAAFYDPEDIIVFEKAQQISLETMAVHTPCKLNRYIGEISPRKFMDFIASELNKQT